MNWSQRSLCLTVPHCFRTLPPSSSPFLTVPPSSSLFRTLPHRSSLFLTVPHFSSPILTLRHCSSLILTVPPSSSLFLTLPHCSSLFLTVPHCSSLFRTFPSLFLTLPHSYSNSECLPFSHSGPHYLVFFSILQSSPKLQLKKSRAIGISQRSLPNKPDSLVHHTHYIGKYRPQCTTIFAQNKKCV